MSMALSILLQAMSVPVFVIHVEAFRLDQPVDVHTSQGCDYLFGLGVGGGMTCPSDVIIVSFHSLVGSCRGDQFVRELGSVRGSVKIIVRAPVSLVILLVVASLVVVAHVVGKKTLFTWKRCEGWNERARQALLNTPTTMLYPRNLSGSTRCVDRNAQVNLFRSGFRSYGESSFEGITCTALEADNTRKQLRGRNTLGTSFQISMADVGRIQIGTKMMITGSDSITLPITCRCIE